MGRQKAQPSSGSTREFPPALSPEEKDNQMISLATDLVEKRLREGTASSQEIVYYLKLGSQKEKLEKQILERQAELMEAKTASLQSAQRIEALFDEAMKMFKVYSGAENAEDSTNLF